MSTKCPTSPTLVALLLAALATSTALAKPLERVPQDGDLRQAIQRVSDGGVIEIAAGIYLPPAEGFRIRNLGKSFTVRAAPGAEVVLDGAGSWPIVVLEDRGVELGQVVSFEGLTFKNGFSAESARGGAVTVEGTSAVFAGCVFDSNAYRGSSRGGGAVLVNPGSKARFVVSRFTGNTSDARGGAIFLFDGASVEVVWSEFEENRVNQPGHGPQAVGGAIYVFDADLEVIGSAFRRNEAAVAGGAIYAFGSFEDAPSGPSSAVRVERSTFTANRVDRSGSALLRAEEQPEDPQSGGAIHVENLTELLVAYTTFITNEATFGGALSIYRAAVEILGSIFEGNFVVPEGLFIAAGGAINLTSSDQPNASTDSGRINRRSASLKMSDSFVRGSSNQRVAADGRPPRGGCLFAAGDVNRELGEGGIPREADAEKNRAVVELDNVVFDDCNVESAVQGTANLPGLGGAILSDLTHLSMTSSMVTNSDALGESAAGGAIFALRNSLLEIDDSTFAQNSAERRGGALMINGGEARIRRALFLLNDVSPSEAEPIQRSPGAAISFSPADDQNVRGVVAESLFTDNVGIPIVDVDSLEPPWNEVVYNNNEVQSTTFGDLIYKNQAVGFGGLTAAELNDLEILRSDGSRTRKSEEANDFLPDVPVVGRLMAAPAELPTTGAPGEEPLGSFVGFAWNGPGPAEVSGQSLAERVGVLEVDTARNYVLRHDGERLAATRVDELPCSGGRLLCLGAERFIVEVDWRDFTGNTGTGSVVPGGADDSGLYFFFDQDNWEMLVKVLNGCSITNHFWVFAAATTNVEYTLRVTDTKSGKSTAYFNPLGNAAAAITDTEALDVCDVKSGDVKSETPPRRRLVNMRELEPKGDCGVDGEAGLCLNQDRFRVEVDWRDFDGNTGRGQAVDLRSDDSGLFYFFDEDNWEMLVKVLNGCPLTNHFWVFAAATTNVEYTLTVTDTQTGTTKSYRNRLGNAASAITDTAALATCP